MATVGAQPGNQNAKKQRVWTAAIERVLERRTKAAQYDAMEKLAESLLDKCEQGDMVALKELGDRLEGKPAQPVTGEGGEGPVRLLVVEKPWTSNPSGS